MNIHENLLLSWSFAQYYLYYIVCQRFPKTTKKRILLCHKVSKWSSLMSSNHDAPNPPARLNPIHPLPFLSLTSATHLAGRLF